MCPAGTTPMGGTCVESVDAGPMADDAGPMNDDAGLLPDAGGCSEETCNGLDDDCDGEVDEALDGSRCGTDEGTCEAGVLRCVDGEGTCEGAVMPAEEECNMVDDDCDGTTDEADVAIGLACGEGEAVGACMPGAVACEDGELVCVGAVEPAEETCNGIDDDCDGTVDEADPMIGASCGTDVGACRTGEVVCMAGALQCAGEVEPVAETCNEVDDDCDGTTDEGVTTTYYPDEDGDGFGRVVGSVEACSRPEGLVDNADDCNDVRSNVFPGQETFFASRDLISGYDYDCDGEEVPQWTRRNNSACTCSGGGIGQYGHWSTGAGVPGCGERGDFRLCERTSVLGECHDRGWQMDWQQRCR